MVSARGALEMKRDIAAVSTFKYGTGTIPAGDSSVDITHGAGSAP
jgi:hypothetical protein